MSSIRTAIELQDNFSSVLYQVIASVNLGLSAMEDLQQTMNAPVDMSSVEAARDSINQTTLAAQELDAAMQGIESPTLNADALSTTSAPMQLSTEVQNVEPLQLLVEPVVPDPLVEPQEPVQVPVVWQSDNMEVFTGTGVERFEQEVQSANNMLNTLNNTQERISQTAAQINLFPANAVSDMNNMENRLQTIQQRIQQIESNPLNMGTATANSELEQLRGQLNQVVQEQENLNCAVENMDVQAANEAYLRLSQTVGNTERYIRDNVDEQGRFNQEINEGIANADNLMNTIKGAVAAYATIQTVGKILDLSDTLTSTAARLNLMNDGLQSTQDLQNMIYLSAQRSRGAYQETANAVSKLGLMAGNAFDSSTEIIAFVEQLNKQFTIAGTEASGVEAAMLQLTQAMGSGVLRGEEYNSILEQAPNIVQNIAEYIEGNEAVLNSVADAMKMKTEDLAGHVQDNLKDIASEGLLSAELVKNAMFDAADETNEKFESMPMTFEQIWTSFENTALMAFQPVLDRLNEIANSDAFQAFVNDAIVSVSLLSSVVLELFDFLLSVGNVLSENWSWIAPLVYGAAAALAVYYGWQLLCAGATWTMSTAQAILNAIMSANPIMLVVFAVIALIAVFYAAVAAVNKFAGTSVSATGIICGAFAAGGAFIGNLFVVLINFVIDIFVVLWNFIAAFANFFATVFNDPVAAIAHLFFDLVDTVLSLLQSLASAIDTIFGSNLAGAVSGWRNSLGGWVDSTFGQGTEIMEKVDAAAYHLDRFNLSNAWSAGNSFGEGIDKSISDFDFASLFDTNLPNPADYADLSNYAADTTGAALGDIGDGVNDVAGNTGSIADSMDITAEDLKYLRDIAEQEVINRFTTAEIKIEQTNHNTVSGKLDLDGVVDGLTDAVNEAVDIIAEGVHDE